MTTIASSFARGMDGWTITGDAASFGWIATGGDRGGYLHWVDAASGDGAFWRAPAKFTGDLSAFVGGRLSFAWFASGHDLPGDDVAITGANGLTLVADAGDPATDWTRSGVRLGVAGHWHVGTSDGPAATPRQIAATLADVTNFLIRAEHVYGNESGGLDSVKLISRPITGDAFGHDRHAALVEHHAGHQTFDASHVVLA